MFQKWWPWRWHLQRCSGALTRRDQKGDLTVVEVHPLFALLIVARNNSASPFHPLELPSTPLITGIRILKYCQNDLFQAGDNLKLNVILQRWEILILTSIRRGFPCYKHLYSGKLLDRGHGKHFCLPANRMRMFIQEQRNEVNLLEGLKFFLHVTTVVRRTQP